MAGSGGGGGKRMAPLDPFLAVAPIVFLCIVSLSQEALGQPPDNVCAAFGCGDDYLPEHPCQCNALCEDHNNCCIDYLAWCTDRVEKPLPKSPPPDADGKESNRSAIVPLSKPLRTTTPMRLVPQQPETSSTTTPPPPPRQVKYDMKPGALLNIDMYRAMAKTAVDTHAVEDDDMADLGGVVKYIHTELLTEHYADPLRTTRKYGIDVLTRKRYKIRNSKKLLGSSFMSQGEFGQFVTFDWGQATNPGQYGMFEKHGDFVGLQQGCGADLQCDVRFPSATPYSWYSVGNWCPNLPWDKKGTKESPNTGCLKHDGSIIKGGLCPGGAGMTEIPTVDPTGEPGCVYSYGKASVVDLDALVGITKMDCDGGVKCRDWLHFRRNCTNPKLKRMFLPSGEIQNVDYCVEFDIHPHCDNCNLPECKSLSNSGQEVYLGLPFWHGRCDPRANVRRLEEAASAFNIPGALQNHIVVSEDLLSFPPPCPRSKGTSWACAPEIAGMAGPLCTRQLNGACQQCYVPGTVMGPDPSPKPFCPLNIFEKAPYDDRVDFPIPKCKTTKASDGCCLYSDTCDGESDPARATLDDDGFALVGARRNTADMEVFLRRASGGTIAASAASDSEAMKWAAYFGWELGPVSRTLAEALAETADIAKHPVIEYSPIVTETPPAAPSGCFELSVSFAPLDMDGSPGGSEASAHACQDRCAKTEDCRHFSFWQSTGFEAGLCHLTDITATPQLGQVGYVSGPPVCWKDLKDTNAVIDKGHHTYVSSDFACMEWGVSYVPPLASGTRIISKADGTNEEVILQCQRECALNDECAQFSVSFPSRICNLVGPAAVRVGESTGTVSGPKECSESSKSAYYRLFSSVKYSAASGPARVCWNLAVSLLACSVVITGVVGVVAISRRVQAVPSNRSVKVPSDEELCEDDSTRSLVSKLARDVRKASSEERQLLPLESDDCCGQQEGLLCARPF